MRVFSGVCLIAARGAGPGGALGWPSMPCPMFSSTYRWHSSPVSGTGLVRDSRHRAGGREDERSDALTSRVLPAAARRPAGPTAGPSRGRGNIARICNNLGESGGGVHVQALMFARRGARIGEREPSDVFHVPRDGDDVSLPPSPKGSLLASAPPAHSRCACSRARAHTHTH